MITELWLLRHGRTSKDSQSRCYGSLDVSLDPAAIEDIRKIAAELPTFSAVYTSPRKRCIDTARVFSSRPSALSELCEINFGDFEGKTYDEIAMVNPEFYTQWMTHPTKVMFPRGESFTVMRNRVLPAVATLLRQHLGETILIVAHGGTNRIILADALGMPEDYIFRIGQKYNAVNLVRYYNFTPVVEIINGFTVAPNSDLVPVR